MTTQTTPRFIRSAVALCGLALFTACGGSSGTTDAKPTSAPAAAVEATKAEAPAEATSAPEPTDVPAPSEAGDSRSIENISSDLSALKSYKVRMTWTWSGKDAAGADKKGGLDWLQEVVTDKATHFKYGVTGNESKGNALDMYQIGQTSYMITAKEGEKTQCVPFSSSDNTQNQVVLKPGEFFGSISDAKLVAKGETVNGVAADHYSVNKAGGLIGTWTLGKGDVWVAQDGNYVVKYVGEGKGAGILFAADLKEGTFGWEYNVDQINSLPDITPPAECANAGPATDIPVPPNATEKTTIGQVISFKSPDPVAKVAEFMKTGLAAQGWTAGQAVDADGASQMSFTKDKRTLQVIVGKEGDGSQVIVSETKTE